MTWAARYSRTEQPELTIYRGTSVISRWDVRPEMNGVTLDSLEVLRMARVSQSLLNDIAARVPVRECIETDACRNHAVDGERCWSHGGSDPL